MRKYVIFCYSNGEGGGQNYVDSKVQYLERNGWEPIVFYPNFRSINKNPYIPWNNLKKFKENCCFELFYRPEYLFKPLVSHTLKWMSDIIAPDGDDVIIESPTDHFAEWGELLAERLHARHLCFLLDEQLEKSVAKEFLYYKYLKKEVAGIHKTSMKRLFQGYKDVPVSDDYVLRAANNGSVADVENEQISKIQRGDYNIGYVGRDKQYCENIVDGVRRFALNNLDKKINFIVLGKINSVSNLNHIENISVVELGFMHPIPKSFFSCVDTIIAGAGCASISAREGVPTIVADAAECMSSGILGYTVDTTLFSNGNFHTFDEELNNVLIKKIHEKIGKKGEYFFVPRDTYDISKKDYEKHIEYIYDSHNYDEYFDFKKNPQSSHLVIKRLIYPLIILRDFFNYNK